MDDGERKEGGPKTKVVLHHTYKTTKVQKEWIVPFLLNILFR